MNMKTINAKINTPQSTVFPYAYLYLKIRSFYIKNKG